MEDKKYNKLKAAFESTQPQVPADFTKRVMKRIEESNSSKKGGRTKSLLYWGRLLGASIAASVVLLLTFHYINNKEVKKVEQPVVVKKTESQRSEPKTIEKEPIQITKEEKAVVALSLIHI